MEQFFLKDIRDFEPFKFSEHESNCLKMSIRAKIKSSDDTWLIGYISASKETFYANPMTLVFVSDEPNRNPLFTWVRYKP